jgi:exodeoxyribonuclease VII large subunit
VTSPQAAALRDILNILRRRHHTVSVLIYPAQVQGETAAAEVSSGVKYFNRAKNVDVIIVARGGGSAEDLAAFNHEGLARVIAGSGIPIISAIGHETDFTIVDFVADLRAPTPSAAAELVIRSLQEIEEQADSLRLRLARAMRYRLLMAKQTLTEVAQHGAFARMMEGINQRQQRLDDLRFRLENSERRLIEKHRRKWEQVSAAIRHYDARRVLAGMRRDHCDCFRDTNRLAASPLTSRTARAPIKSALSRRNFGARLCSGLRFVRKADQELRPG